MSLMKKIDSELKKNIDVKHLAKWGHNKSGAQVWLGVKTPITRKISSKYFNEAKTLKKKEIIKICEKLLDYRLGEYKTIAFDWHFRLKDQYEVSDFKILESWVTNRITDWSDCDDLCTHAVGEFLIQFPNKLPRVIGWAKSKNWVVRRAAAVALIYPLRKGLYIDEAIKTASVLLFDRHDLVNKGYGWMLKEASRNFEKDVLEFILKNKKNMSRVSLRYAIEKMSKAIKAKAM
ncbi:MAG TPA: DNA alkylation repair protein [Bacteriovoracaceae bacterium]|nr:DNA alkylation repair protein [Bacteriovoracaceae bacterium]